MPNSNRRLARVATRHTGTRFEQLALNFLLTQGLRLRECNFYCRLGEIDLVMQDGDKVIFVEVRYRQSKQYGGALASITYPKRLRLQRAAQYYLYQHKMTAFCRFDVVAIHPKPQGGYDINWIKQAFDT